MPYPTTPLGLVVPEVVPIRQMLAKIEGMSRDIEQLTRVVGLYQNRLASTETSVGTGDRHVLPDINDNALARQAFESSVGDTAQGHDRSILDQPCRPAGRLIKGQGWTSHALNPASGDRSRHVEFNNGMHNRPNYSCYGREPGMHADVCNTGYNPWEEQNGSRDEASSGPAPMDENLTCKTNAAEHRRRVLTSETQWEGAWRQTQGAPPMIGRVEVRNPIRELTADEVSGARGDQYFARGCISVEDNHVHTTQLPAAVQSENMHSNSASRVMHSATWGLSKMKIPPFTGKENWAVWSAKFDVIASRYRWTDDERLDNLLPRIEGQASEFVFTQLPKRVLTSYRDLVYELTARYRVIETPQAFAAKLSKRNQRQGETAEEYDAELQRLYDKAHPNRARGIRNEDLVRKFLDGLLDSDVRFEVEYHKEPKDLEEAVFQVVSLIQVKNGCKQDRPYKSHVRRTVDDGTYEQTEQVNRVPESKPIKRIDAPNRRLNASGSEQPKDDQHDVLNQILARLKKLEDRDATGPFRKGVRLNVECYKCHNKGHYARECPSRNAIEEKQRCPTKGMDEVKHLNGQGPSRAPEERSI
ncbi:hypothetical protein DPMN_100757 [Dreissena polymorpha]|uniref:CCHC-type domain-containing protein n=1 Tax=Dreissena polymorpha TaxID=45954 RepID=A0A9D4R8Y6_DREPO|nr:hypothetical protein DPMN_100757 [Dreissena polymorpha]